MLRRFQFIRSPSPAQFSGCQGYLQPGGEGTGTGGSWKKGKLHKFWERSAQRQRHSTGRKGREGKEPEPGKNMGREGTGVRERHGQLRLPLGRC